MLVEEGGEGGAVGAHSGGAGLDAGAAADAEGGIGQHFHGAGVQDNGSGGADCCTFTAERAAVGGHGYGRDVRSVWTCSDGGMYWRDGSRTGTGGMCGCMGGRRTGRFFVRTVSLDVERCECSRAFQFAGALSSEDAGIGQVHGVGTAFGNRHLRCAVAVLSDEGSGGERGEAQREGQVVELDQRVLIVPVAVGHSYDGRYGCTRCYLYAFEPLDGLRSYSAGVDRCAEDYGFARSQDYRLIGPVEGQVYSPDKH